MTAVPNVFIGCDPGVREVASHRRLRDALCDLVWAAQLISEYATEGFKW